jgi:DNA-binding MarR family transcriptional regulator
LRTELIGLVLDELTGWQVDQDLFDYAAAEYAGLNRTDTRCLDLLGRHGPMTAGHLATEARLTSGAVTAVVDRLERLGLVRRTRDTVDRRRVLVEVTPEVRRLMGPVYDSLVDEGMALMDRYTDDELAFIARFLKDNRAILRAHTDRVHGLVADRRASGRGGADRDASGRRPVEGG